MKRPSTFLFDLIKSLTKSEKRYVSVQAGSGAKDYLQLMDALIAQKTYDEDKLIEDNEGANFIRHLAVNKQYLYELLLKLLTHFGQKTLEDKVFQKITAANVLMGKGLFAAANSELRKGQKIAEKYELFELQIILCNIEKRMLSGQQLKKKVEEISDKIFNVEKNCLEQLNNTNEYWYLTQQIVQFQRRHQKIQNKEQRKYVERLISSPKFQSESHATNFKSKLYYYQAKATYQFMLGNVEKAYEINKSFLDLLEARSHFLRLYAERYLATLNNMLIDSLVIGKYNILKTGIERLDMTLERAEFKTIKNIESRVFRQRYLLLINWSLRQKDFEKAMDWIPQIEKGLEQFGKKIEKHHHITFYYLVAYILFLNKKYGEALKWNNLILNDSKEDVVKEIYYFARVLNLLIHYELGNYALLESLLLSTPKYLRSRRPVYETEKVLFRYLGKLLKSIDEAEKQKAHTEFRDKIHDLFQQPGEKRVFNYLDLRLWVTN